MEEINKNVVSREERESIINEAIERVLLVTPEVIGNLITDHVAMNKINTDFYKNHPEFKDHKDTVASVIEKVNGENPLLDYKDVLGKGGGLLGSGGGRLVVKVNGENPLLDHKDLLGRAVPEIQRRIETVGSLDMETVSPNPSRTYEPLSVPKVEDPHGKL